MIFAGDLLDALEQSVLNDTIYRQMESLALLRRAYNTLRNDFAARIHLDETRAILAGQLVVVVLLNAGDALEVIPIIEAILVLGRILHVAEHVRETGRSGILALR